MNDIEAVDWPDDDGDLYGVDEDVDPLDLGRPAHLPQAVAQ
ncbi:hypothetical protein [Frankia sp. AgW1.1]|nr:hypothetical protein [Frankia sp. AgW1.1]